MFRKWWMIAMVFALALSLTSCARRPPGQFSNYGVDLCVGSMGQIFVYTVAVDGQPGIYRVVIIPATLDAPGDVASVTLLNQQTLQYDQVREQVALFPQQEYSVANITEQELQTYDVVAITSFMPGSNMDFWNSVPEKDAYCSLPFIGQGVL